MGAPCNHAKNETGDEGRTYPRSRITIRRGTFLCVGELERAIYQWMSNWNNEPQPFVWKATADVILDKVRRCKEAIAKN